jgi:thiol-disulfide isomerase/thioredoxin
MGENLMNAVRFSIFSLIVVIFTLFGCSIDDSSLKVGMKAPSLKTKTLADVGGDFSRITTYRYPDKRMYLVSLDDALKADKTIVLEFATPGHCTVCDKQLQMLKALLAKYEKEVIFLHMDQYENPQAFKAFGVIGDPWTYVIDGTQTVRFKQSGRMLYSELDMIINSLLNEQGQVQSSTEAG